MHACEPFDRAAGNGLGRLSVILYLFTTLPLTVEQLVQLYGQRWNVETDLRSLKRTVDLQVLHCKSADMIAKELVLAIVGYNLVRAVMNAAAGEYSSIRDGSVFRVRKT